MKLITPNFFGVHLIEFNMCKTMYGTAIFLKSIPGCLHLPHTKAEELELNEMKRYDDAK